MRTLLRLSALSMLTNLIEIIDTFQFSHTFGFVKLKEEVKHLAQNVNWDWMESISPN
jgi:hypothetical protein